MVKIGIVMPFGAFLALCKLLLNRRYPFSFWFTYQDHAVNFETNN